MTLLLIGLAALGLFGLLANIVTGVFNVLGKILPPLIIIVGIIFILCCIAG